MERKGLLTIREAAELLGISIDTLRRWDAAGKLRAVRGGERGHRHYRQSDIDLFMSDLMQLAQNWAGASAEIPGRFYCSDATTFQGRLLTMQTLLMQNRDTETTFSLIVAAAGEIGNNSYDHNLGNWPDVPGVFFGYDIGKRVVVLADRGLGVLHTLRRVRAGLQNHEEALRVAFTEIVSGRAPEARGNGLKFVREVVQENGFHLTFQSGDAELSLDSGDDGFHVRRASTFLRGCLASITF